ncbi:MAG: protein kinase [Planctomycetaceae bacterium]|nr:protein kinase [Planctomycetaceae bacterium]
MTKLGSSRICAGYEPIPGYVLEERIGHGGYGEVWRASAPGGLKKAVKFVFGSHKEARALRELKSLERIRQVQHPFLLTLERFEAIENQLVIVTELADGSLENVFQEACDVGSCGIARNVLISHMHDVADALDYLHEKHQLQHLDIKPGNLLLFGDHVKVADFGLVKDLGDVDCSAVVGLTPSYAPPELFDGQPGKNSDQYSLAVMYQELLTGTLPFNGSTIAQLATQHVHAAPNLDSLPAHDRPVIARALEKNPTRRFANCKAFVDALVLAGSVSPQVTVDHPTPITSQEVDGEVNDLPKLAVLPRQATGKRQVLVVGLGGLGGSCLRAIGARLNETIEDFPVVAQGVLIDTDAESCQSLSKPEGTGGYSRCKFVHTPLKTPQQYRDYATSRLGSISRRWIYNVPRNGTTTGMRPLGRLALVDNSERIREVLLESVKAITGASGEQTPVVYVVGSLCGGTASGMYLDVVHLLRNLLDEVGSAETQVRSLLVTPCLESSDNHPLAVHSAMAAMKEIRHCLDTTNGYPGDVGAGWSSVPAARSPLRNAYFISLPPRGSLLRSVEESISQYVLTDSGYGHSLLASARELEANELQTLMPISVRSFAAVPLVDQHQARREMLVAPLVRNLLLGWLGLPSQARIDAIELSRRVMRRAGLLSEDLSDDRQAWMACANSLQRELAVCLCDRRADVTTVLECLKCIDQWCESQQSLEVQVVQEMSARISAKLERYATVLAMGIVETNKIQSADQDPWPSMPLVLQQQFGDLVNEIHSRFENEWLVRPMMQSRYEVEPISMVRALCGGAEQILRGLLDAPESESEFEAPHGVSVVSVSTSVMRVHSQPDFREEGDSAPRCQPGSPLLTVEQAVSAAKPALLSVGGLHRMILVVGSEYEKQQLESQVRAAYDGTLSVAIVHGALPHLIHEAQQIELAGIIARFSEFNRGNEQVTARLTSRSDITW